MALFDQESIDMVIARNIVKRSAFGRTGAFRVGDDGSFISNLDGRSFTSISGVYEELQSRSITNFATVNQQSRIGDPYANLSQILRNITREIGSADASSPMGRFLFEELGLTTGMQNTLSANVLQVKDKRQGSKALAQNILDQLKRGELSGLPLFDDEGGRIVEFVFGRSTGDAAESGIKLTESQIHRLLMLSNSSLVSSEGMQGVKDSSDLFKLLSKLPKRLRGFTSPRDLVIDNEMFGRMFTGSSIESQLFGIDIKYDLLFGKVLDWDEIGKGSAQGQRSLRAIYGVDLPQSGYRTLIDEIFEKSLQGIDAEDFQNVLRQAFSGIGGPERVTDFANLKSKVLEENFENLLNNISDTGKAENYRKAFKNIMDAIEKSDDGSIMMNRGYIKRISDEIKQEIDLLKNQIELMPTGAEELKEKYSALLKLKSRIDSGDLESITLRGSAFGQLIKSAATFVGFSKELDSYLGIITEFALKPESGFNNSTNLIFSGFGRSGNQVFTDAVGAAFNPEIYGSEEALQGYRESIKARISKLESVLETGIIPEELRKSIESSALAGPDEFTPEYRGPSSLRNRQFMEELDVLIKAGASPKHHPKLANMLHKYIMSDAIKQKDGLYQVILDDTFRFAINTEEKLTSVQGTVSAFMGADGKPSTKEVISLGGQDIELTKFRVKGHTMYLPGSSVSDLFDTLGGFDLDDKGIPRMVFTGEGGERKLAFFTLRQPQGVQEYVLMAMNYDNETVKSIFGGSNTFGKSFRSTLESMVLSDPNQHNTNIHSLLRKLDLQSSVTTNQPYMHDSYRQAINEVLDVMMGEKLVTIQDIALPEFALRDELIASKGAPLKNYAGAEAGFTKLGLLKMQTQGSKAASEVAKEEFLQILEELSEQDKYIGTVRDLITRNRNDLDQLIVASRNLPEFSEILDQAFVRMNLLAAAQEENILGAYVNTSMMVGSTRQQIGKLSELDPSLADKINRNPIFLPGQEFPIDLSTTLNIGGVEISRDELLRRAYYDLDERGIIMSEDNISRYLSTMGLNEEALKEINLDKLTNYQQKSLGRQMALATSSFYSLDDQVAAVNQDLFPGVDRKIFERVFKESETSAETFLGEYMETLESEISLARNQNQATRADKIQERYNFLQNIRTSGDTESKADDLINAFALRAGSKYAAVESTHTLALEGMNYSEYLLRSAIIRSNDPYYGFLSSQVDEESVNMARFLIDQNKDEIENLYNNVTKSYLDQESDELLARRLNFQLKFQQQMYEASGGERQTFSNLVNALDLEFFRREYRFDMARDYLVDDMSSIGDFSKKISETIVETTKVGRSNFYTQTASELSKDLTTLLTRTGEASIVEAAEALLDSQAGNLGEMAQEVLKTIIGKQEDDTSQMLARQRSRQAVSEEVYYVNNLFSQAQTSSAPQYSVDFPTASIPDDARAMYENLDTTLPSSRATPYKRFTFDTLKNMFTDPTVRRSSYLLGALILGSFMYQSSKDRTADDMSGPPLLPGGSGYETTYPRRMPQIGSYAPNDVEPTLSYKISFNGSYEQVQELNRSIGNMGIGRINATMYNSLPGSSRDPYSEIASSF
jgi:hypothetical protein